MGHKTTSDVREAENNQQQKTANNAIGGRFLNIGNMNNLSTWKDELLHAKMKK